MGQNTDIQWCDSTVNPTTGCDGCELWGLLKTPYPEQVGRKGGPCYAGPIHEGRLAKSLPKLYAPDFTEVRLAPGRMAKAAAWPDLRGKPRPGKPWLDGLPRLIFVGDMGDLLSGAVPFEYLADELIGAATSPKGARHIWQVLTKRPARLAEFARWLREERGVDWPENVWSGTSVTSNASVKRINALLRVPGTRFLSLEPLREWVDLGRWMSDLEVSRDEDGNDLGSASGGSDLDWVIIGGESEQPPHEAHPFDLDWARRAIKVCRSAGVAPFVKQLGSCPVEGLDGPGGWTSVMLHDHHGGDWSEWPEELRARQFPEVTP